MERRSEPRLQTDQPVDVGILTTPPVSCKGTVVEISGRGLRLALPVDVSPGVAVRVDLGDSLLLGEVCHHASTPQGFIVGLVLEHSLTGLHQLENLRRTLLESATESAPGSREDREISKVL